MENILQKLIGSAMAISLILTFGLAGLAQTNEEKLAEATKIYAEATALFRESTAESLRAAVPKFKTASELFRQTGTTEKQATSLLAAGSIAQRLGEKAEALEIYNQVLPLFRLSGNKEWEGATLNNIGSVYDDLGEKQKALEFYNQALPLRGLVGDKNGESATLNNIGKVYSDLGDKQKALELYNQALPLSRLVGNKSGEVATLNNIGRIHSALGERQKALELFNQALILIRSVGDKSGEASTLGNIGGVYFAMGENQKALEHYKQALLLRRLVGDKRGEATALTSIGGIFDALGEKHKALEYFQASLPLRKIVGDTGGQANTLYWLMFYWNSLKNPRYAVFYGKQSVNLYQELRRKINALDKETQKTYLKSIENTYRYLAEILIAESRIAEAEEVLAMLKEEEFFAYLRRDDKVARDLKGRISLSPEEKKAFEEYEKVADEITRTAREFSVLDKKKNALPLGQTLAAADQQQFDTLKQKYDAAVVVFNTFLNDLKGKFGTNDKRVAIVESDTQGILKRLNQPQTVIISTIVGEDRLNLIVTTADIQRAHTVDVKAVDLNRMVSEFREAVKDPTVDPRPLGKKLYDTLFPAALQKDLDGIKADTIVWSLDGTLRYVPIAALWDGKQYLVERYTNAVLTLASRDKLSATVTDRTKWQALGVGVSKEYQTFPALAAVPQELCSVIRDPKKKEFCAAVGKQKTGVIGGLMLPDDEFTLQSFENNIGKVPVVHIASHFSLNAGNESDSYLLLGGGAERRFSIANLRKTRLDGLELLTLSACNTAMTAGDNSSGVEVEGFGALAQNQGAKTILATLWSVADDSTRDLMTEFYTRLETDPKIGKAEGLRQSQLALLNGNYKSGETSAWRGADLAGVSVKDSLQPKFKTDPRSPFAHPFYWSPFVLSGNWR